MADYPWEDVTPPKLKRNGFTAMYDGLCGGGDLISAGDEIRSYAGEYWHVDCADDDAEVPEPIVTCPKCWTVHAGECL